LGDGSRTSAREAEGREGEREDKEGPERGGRRGELLEPFCITGLRISTVSEEEILREDEEEEK